MRLKQDMAPDSSTCSVTTSAIIHIYVLRQGLLKIRTRLEWHLTPEVLALRKWKQEVQEFKVILQQV